MVRRIVAYTCCTILLQALFFSSHAMGNGIEWSEKEQAFMRDHPIIRVGVDPQFVPFEFFDRSGNYTGLASEYINYILQKTGLRLEIEQGLTWPQAYEKAVRRDLDLLPAIGKTEAREEHFLFSDSYLQFKRVIVTHDTNSSIGGVKDLFGKTVAVQANSSHHSYLLGIPQIHLSLYSSVEEALTNVANGSEVAFLGNLATTNYLIRNSSLTNLRFVSFEAEKQEGLYFAVRKDWPELVSIINKVLSSMSEVEQIAIKNKWINIERELDYGPVVRIALLIGSIIVLVLAVSAFWIFRLHREIGTRKRIQQDLEVAKSEAEKASTIKSDFLSRMSHEIRTPLNAIMGMTAIALKTNDTAKIHQYLAKVDYSSQQLLSLINDVLDMAKIESGKFEIAIHEFHFEEMLQNVINVVRVRLDEKRQDLYLDIPVAYPRKMLSDGLRLSQVLINLLTNAIKFTPENGKIAVRIEERTLDPDTSILHVEVQDNGIGIQEEKLQTLFNPFEQADGGITRKYGGSGLGLSICEKIVSLMDGNIRVESRFGHGSTFIFEVKVGWGEDVATHQLQIMPQDLRVLVVDDCEDTLDYFSRILKGIPLHFDAVSRVPQALRLMDRALADGDPYGVIFLDWHMPGLDGRETAYKLRERAPDSVIVILISATEWTEVEQDMTAINVTDFLPKPVLPSVLPDTLVQLSGQAVKSEKTNDSTYDWREKRILLVEDIELNREIILSILEETGVAIDCACDGRQAVTQFQDTNGAYDAILMDMQMPVLDGLGATREIRALSHPRAQRVPIIAMTANAFKEDAQRCMEAGMNNHITKPLEVDVLFSTLSQYLDH